MLPLQVVNGDAVIPQGNGPKIIAHVCNDIGAWGKGFVLAISRRWPEPEQDYRRWHRDRAGNDFTLGAVRLVHVQPDIWVANMIGQHDIRRGAGGPPIRYEAVSECLTTQQRGRYFAQGLGGSSARGGSARQVEAEASGNPAAIDSAWIAVPDAALRLFVVTGSNVTEIAGMLPAAAENIRAAVETGRVVEKRSGRSTGPGGDSQAELTATGAKHRPPMVGLLPVA